MILGMIRRKAKGLWVGVFLTASASLVATGVALPMLDRDLYAAGEVIEPEHDAGTCAVAHNHALCMVWAGSELLASISPSGPLAYPGVVLLAAESTGPGLSVAELRPANSRAPPTL